MKTQKRLFIPTSEYVGNTNVFTSVKQWIWKRGKGLFVEYYDGLKTKSDYTLPELLKTEKVREIKI